MAKFTAAPWWASIGDDHIVIFGADGDSICAMRRNTGDHLPEEQEANANVMALAPELFRSLVELVHCMRVSDVENLSHESIDSEFWDGALEDAQALIDLLAESGITADYIVKEIRK